MISIIRATILVFVDRGKGSSTAAVQMYDGSHVHEENLPYVYFACALVRQSWSQGWLRGV